MDNVSEGLELFGGQGYIEDSGLPQILRDAQVGTIWEGTTNVQSADFLRALVRSKGQAFVALGKLVDWRCDDAAWPKLRPSADALKRALADLRSLIHGAMLSGDSARVEANARELLWSTGRVVMGAALLEHAQWSALDSDRAAVDKWVLGQDLISRALAVGGGADAMDAALALDVGADGKPRGCGDVQSDGTARARL